ncbi:pantoate--beta-alanine ligase [Candidatus Acidulodesulfobacterium sp. H_13]|uniref:pantoate--beta-alanine ligase n=1 Tax=Candidatus Acidulodesulfobacterium sp. H_13 TaxID=3395470 RepID=UPI003AF65248
MKIITSIAEMKRVSGGLKKYSRSVSFIPTMGKLHEGHIKLIEEGKKYGEAIVSIFVNPMQFAPDEDYDSYPRDYERDIEILKNLGIKYLFYPTADIVENSATFVINPEYSDRLCGLFRTDHFRGVLTIVMKLFCIITPNFAFFGLKDYQQYVLIKKAAEDFFLDVKVIPVKTVREKCGLAMSSRNAYFNDYDRGIAGNFYKALKETVDLFNAGEKLGENLVFFAIKKLIKNGFKVDYVKITDKDLNIKEQSVRNGDIMLSAVEFKGVRLIDNIFFETLLKK